MSGPICANCGFHNEADAVACVSCGYMLSDAAASSAGDAAADPQAMTQHVASVQPCWNCGAPNEQTRTFCQACGQQLRSGTQAYPAAAPAATAAAAPGMVPGPPAARGLPLGTDVHEPRVHRRWAPFLGAAVLGALLVAATFVIAGMLGQDGLGGLFGGLGGDRAASPAAPTGETARNGRASPSPRDAASGEGFRCEAQVLEAPEAGVWTVTRARWGQRSRFDYISFVLRRGGSSEETARVTAELVPLDDVEARFGVDEPDDGDVALVVTFDSPIDLSGPFGREPEQRVLQSFELVRSDGVVYAVLGISGSGCFEMTAPGWQNGSPRNVEIRLDIERG